MKKLLIITISLISFAGMSQSKYEQGMTKAFGLWEEQKQWEAANLLSASPRQKWTIGCHLFM